MEVGKAVRTAGGGGNKAAAGGGCAGRIGVELEGRAGQRVTGCIQLLDVEVSVCPLFIGIGQGQVDGGLALDLENAGDNVVVFLGLQSAVGHGIPGVAMDGSEALMDQVLAQRQISDGVCPVVGLIQLQLPGVADGGDVALAVPGEGAVNDHDSRDLILVSLVGDAYDVLAYIQTAQDGLIVDVQAVVDIRRTAFHIGSGRAVGNGNGQGVVGHLNVLAVAEFLHALGGSQGNGIDVGICLIACQRSGLLQVVGTGSYIGNSGEIQLDHAAVGSGEGRHGILAGLVAVQGELNAVLIRAGVGSGLDQGQDGILVNGSAHLLGVCIGVGDRAQMDIFALIYRVHGHGDGVAADDGAGDIVTCHRDGGGAGISGNIGVLLGEYEGSVVLVDRDLVLAGGCNHGIIHVDKGVAVAIPVDAGIDPEPQVLSSGHGGYHAVNDEHLLDCDVSGGGLQFADSPVSVDVGIIGDLNGGLVLQGGVTLRSGIGVELGGVAVGIPTVEGIQQAVVVVVEGGAGHILGVVNVVSTGLMAVAAAGSEGSAGGQGGIGAVGVVDSPLIGNGVLLDLFLNVLHTHADVQTCNTVANDDGIQKFAHTVDIVVDDMHILQHMSFSLGIGIGQGQGQIDLNEAAPCQAKTGLSPFVAGASAPGLACNLLASNSDHDAGIGDCSTVLLTAHMDHIGAGHADIHMVERGGIVVDGLREVILLGRGRAGPAGSAHADRCAAVGIVHSNAALIEAAVLLHSQRAVVNGIVACAEGGGTAIHILDSTVVGDVVGRLGSAVGDHHILIPVAVAGYGEGSTLGSCDFRYGQNGQHHHKHQQQAQNSLLHNIFLLGIR